MNKVVNLIAIILFCHTLNGQNATGLSRTEYPPETLNVHLTRNFLLSGEVIGFKIYCSNPFFPDLELSRIAFIELVSEENVPVLRKKIILEHGAGAGEFVLPEHLVSGIYTVLTYTNWMKNFGEESFDRKHITIVNPLQRLVQCSDTCNCSQNDQPGQVISEISNSGLSLVSDKIQYTTREQVSVKVKLNPEEGEFAGGTFSISVCYSEPAQCPAQKEKNVAGAQMNRKEIEYLPDFGGIRLTGKLEDASGQAMENAPVILSEPGPGTKISSTHTDKEGNFHFLVTPREGEIDLVFTMPASDAIIKMEEPYWNGFRTFPVQQEFCLSENAISFLEEMYVHYQLQQRFNQTSFSKIGKSDLNMPDSSRFYTSNSRLLKMDDYILLDSLAEYFYELVPSVRFVRSKGSLDIRVSDPVSGFPYEEKPGVFVDGVLYPDYVEVSRIPVRKIEEIAVVPEVYYYGDFSFGGIIDLHTVDSDFNAVQMLPDMLRLICPLASGRDMIFNTMNFSVPGVVNRIPEFRHLICWEPDFKLGASGENSIQFNTGDLSGDFTITVCGLSHDGKLFRSTTRISVDGKHPVPDQTERLTGYNEM